MDGGGKLSGGLAAKASAAKSLCLATFFLLGNYFALYGLAKADRAVAELASGRRDSAERLIAEARRWGIWGLVPSALINAALIFLCFAALWKLGLKDLFEAYSAAQR